MKTLSMAALSTTVLGLLLSCGGGGGGGDSTYTPPPPPPPANTIYVGDNSGYGASNIFAPATLTVTAGTTVTWNWQVSGHTVDSIGGGADCTPDSVLFTSGGVQSAGHTMTYKFDTPGTYKYACKTHCSVMTGTVVVN